MKRYVCVLLVLLPCSAVQSKEYDFNQAYAHLLRVDNTLSASRRETAVYGFRKRSAQGLRYPSLGVKGNFSKISDPITIDLNGIRAAVQPLYPSGVTLPDFALDVQDEKFFKAQAYASLPIYTGGKITAAVSAASAEYGAAEAKREAVENNLLVELAAKYFGLLLAEQTVQVRRTFLDNARQNAEDGAKMFRAGTISHVEKMAVDVQLAQAKRDYNTAVNNAATAQTLLDSLLAEPEPVRVRTRLFVLPQEQVPSLALLQQNAQAKNPVLTLLANKTVLSAAQEKKERAEFLPSVYLFASRELYTNDLTILEPDYAYGVGFAWNLFEGGQSYYKTKAAQEQTHSLELLKAQQLTDITTGIEYHYQKMQNARETYDALQQELEFTESFYNARRLGFKAGTATSLEVNMALSQWLKTRLDSLKAQYEFVTSLAAVLNLSGQPELFAGYLQGV
ncbi:TolC family protein [Candidatus Avelusimicrobium fimicolum]|uniref:TolC family protein n=1 Tax=Candidatus Avelusimicrobium fimicolum TaxID=3416216 RepID=UPI0015AB65A2